MRAEVLGEPELDFGMGRHVDVRFGIQRHSVLDFDDAANREMRVGIVGTNETIDAVSSWLSSLTAPIGAKESNQPNMTPGFPGVSPDAGFHLKLNVQPDLCSAISSRELDELLNIPRGSELAMEAAEEFADRVRQLQEDQRVNVILCAVPLNLAERTLNDNGENEIRDFHHALKAKCLSLRTPTQIILPHTYNSNQVLKRKTKQTLRTVQDDATKAWNFVTALYYKGGGTPWRMRREAESLQTCYIGIGFYKLLDGSALQASVAQVFDERGEGVIVRGAMASLYKDDRHPYLEAKDSESLLLNALKEYRGRHKHAPARVVIHKSSPFRQEEIEGFNSAINQERIDQRNYVSVGDSDIRLFRKGEYPPLRGTLLELEDAEAVLYTTGSVNFYKTYPGLYVPRPIHLRAPVRDDSIRQIAADILSLSKMNWNKTQMSGALPITLEATRNVGNILKYLDPDSKVQNTYRFFM